MEEALVIAAVAFANTWEAKRPLLALDHRERQAPAALTIHVPEERISMRDEDLDKEPMIVTEEADEALANVQAKQSNEELGPEEKRRCWENFLKLGWRRPFGRRSCDGKRSGRGRQGNDRRPAVPKLDVRRCVKPPRGENWRVGYTGTCVG